MVTYDYLIQHPDVVYTTVEFQQEQQQTTSNGHSQMQSSVQAFKIEHQSRQAKRGPMAKPGKNQRQGGRNQGGGGRVFDTAKQARSEKEECEAILRVKHVHMQLCFEDAVCRCR